MAVPKRRHSKSRKRKRRAHQALSKPNFTACPVCNHLRPPHHICPNCGSYGSLKVIKHEGT